MGYKSVLGCAISQIGQHNDADGSNKYIAWYYGRRIIVPWCAIFIAWCFEQVGIYDRLDGLTNKAGCVPWQKWAQKKGYWTSEGRKGDLVLFDWNKYAGDGPDHIGVVESVFGGGVVSIEGNTSENGSQSNGGKVLRKNRYNSDIAGFIHIDTTAPQEKPDPAIPFTRIGGANRYSTNQTVIAELGDSFPVCVLASGESFPDALSASYLARNLKAPLLLTDPDGVVSSAWVKRHISANNDVINIFIVGGESAITKAYEDSLAKQYNVMRVAGADRYSTNLAALRYTGAGDKKLIIVSGTSFADGIVAGCVGIPVMLCGKWLTYAQLDWIAQKIDIIYLLGGTSVVSAIVEGQAKELAIVKRIAGLSRYETAKLAAKEFYPATAVVTMATGRSYPDGLSACNMAAPLLLCDGMNNDQSRDYNKTQNLTKAYIIGGTRSVPDIAANWALTK